MPAYDLGRVLDFRRWPRDYLDRLVFMLTFKKPANDNALRHGTDTLPRPEEQ
jgi:hypothetical protein